MAVLRVDRPRREEVKPWRFLSSGGGLTDYCAAFNDLQAVVEWLREEHFEVDGLTDDRRRPTDGKENRCLITRIRQEEGRELSPPLRGLTATPARLMRKLGAM